MANFTIRNLKSGAECTAEIPTEHLHSAETAAKYLQSIGHLPGRIRTIASAKGSTHVTTVVKGNRLPVTWVVTFIRPEGN